MNHPPQPGAERVGALGRAAPGPTLDQDMNQIHQPKGARQTMPNITHTKAEREAIRDAYYHIARLLDRVNRAGYAWEEAYKLERKERSSMPAAQALCVESFLQGYTTKTSAATVWYFSTGCGLSLQLGAMLKESHRQDRKAGRTEYPEKPRLKLLRAAGEAHQDYIARRLEWIR